VVHLVQVGAGSGGMPVLDLVCRDPRVTRLTLIEPDVYKPHNVVRHLFPASAVGQLKADLARQWLLDRRPEVVVETLACDLFDPAFAPQIEAAVASADLGICAADNENAKFRWDALMRRHSKPWTLGEVLSGGIGGFVHRFVPGGPCYGCVASHLKRSVTVETPKAPDYSQPGGPAPEVTIPASRTSIAIITGLHAQVTLQLLAGVRSQSSGVGEEESSQRTSESAPGETKQTDSSLTPGPRPLSPDWTSFLLTLEKVPGIFDEAFKPFRFRVARSAECLICRADAAAPSASADLDAALDQALARLGHA
jgi:sulfur-carrier protein adenylyltransferase/sulfurtransferase